MIYINNPNHSQSLAIIDGKEITVIAPIDVTDNVFKRFTVADKLGLVELDKREYVLNFYLFDELIFTHKLLSPILMSNWADMYKEVNHNIFDITWRYDSHSLGVINISDMDDHHIVNTLFRELREEALNRELIAMLSYELFYRGKEV